MLQAGVIGLGALGTVHLNTLLGLREEISVAALSDPLPERRTHEYLSAQSPDEYETVSHVRSYANGMDLCTDPDLDLVCIATPSDLHAHAAVAALENGKHVFTEKPMALTYADCRMMMDAARANDRLLMVGQVLRFSPEYSEMKTIIDSGRYGKTVAATLHRYGAKPLGRWFADTARSGGVNLDLHIHDIDAALWWWGRPSQVDARCMGISSGVSVVLSRWEYSDGPTVQLEASWDAGIPFAAEFKIMFEKATIRYDSRAGGGLTVYTHGASTELKPEGEPAHAAELRYFVDCIVHGVAVDRCPPEESALAVNYALGGALINPDEEAE